METGCETFRDRIPRLFLGDLATREQEALEHHISGCRACADEKESYSRTLQHLQSVADEPLPRHFFVYPPESGFRFSFLRLAPGWYAAMGAAAVLAAALGLAALARVQVRSQDEGYLVGIGTPVPAGTPAAPAAPAIDTAALEARILHAVDERNRRVKLEWLRTFRAELGRAQSRLTAEQRKTLASAVSEVEARLTARVDSTAQTVLQHADASISGLYAEVTAERTRDLAAVGARIDRLAVTGAAKNNQTDAILETLLQVAESRVK